MSERTLTTVETIGHRIGGRAVPGLAARTSPVFDPARGVEVARVSASSLGRSPAVAVRFHGLADAQGAD